MAGSYPRTENDTPNQWEKTEEQISANDNMLGAISRVIQLDGYFVGPYSPVKQLTIGLDTSTHHIVQNITVKGELTNYNKNQAPSISLSDRSGRVGTEHHAATMAQRQASVGGTLGAEYKVAEAALQAAGLPEGVVNAAMNMTKDYFSEIGYNENTNTKTPANRKV